jgi:hypothetical protein
MRFSEPIQLAFSSPIPTPAVDRQLFAAVDRAATEVEQSLFVGANVHDFTVRVGALATEVALTSRNVQTDLEVIIAAHYMGALGAYRYSALIWESSVRHGDYRTLDEEAITKFGIPEHMGTDFGYDTSEKKYYIPDVNQHIWRYASSLLAKARGMVQSGDWGSSPTLNSSLPTLK